MAETLYFTVLSSDRVTTYDLQAFPTASGVRFACSCQAGQNDTLCKHRLMLFDGEASLLKSLNVAEIGALQAMLNRSPIADAIRTLRELEGEAERLKAAIAAQKKAVVRAMRG